MSKFREIWHNSKPIFKLIWSAFAAVGIVLGVLIPISNFLFPDRAEPRYMIISDELAVSSPTSKIKLYFDSTEVPNVKIMQVALWNGGNNYIDKEKLINSYIAEVSSLGVKILQADISKKSRDELKLTTQINNTQEKVFLFLKGEEVFESEDGIIVKIFYTSSSNSEWTVLTRIKGIPKGFQNIKLSGKSKNSFFIFSNSITDTEIIFNFMILLIVILISIERIILLKSIKHYFLMNSFSTVVITILISFIMIGSIYSIYIRLKETVMFPEFIE